jgi:hypothetical protein
MTEFARRGSHSPRFARGRRKWPGVSHARCGGLAKQVEAPGTVAGASLRSCALVVGRKRGEGGTLGGPFEY